MALFCSEVCVQNHLELQLPRQVITWPALDRIASGDMRSFPQSQKTRKPSISKAEVKTKVSLKYGPYLHSSYVAWTPSLHRAQPLKRRAASQKRRLRSVQLHLKANDDPCHTESNSDLTLKRKKRSKSTKDATSKVREGLIYRDLNGLWQWLFQFLWLPIFLFRYQPLIRRARRH